MKRILIASTNQHKIDEIIKILKGFELISLDKYQDIPEPDEPYDSFAENANYKAKYYADITGEVSLSDDTGICIESLNNFPGVFSKRVLFQYKTMKNTVENLRKLLNNKQLNAHFVSAISVYNPSSKKIISVEGKVYGSLKLDEESIKGFGYDPIFIPNGYTETFEQLGKEIKNQISHRAIALKKILAELSAL